MPTQGAEVVLARDAIMSTPTTTIAPCEHRQTGEEEKTWDYGAFEIGSNQGVSSSNETLFFPFFSLNFAKLTPFKKL